MIMASRNPGPPSCDDRASLSGITEALLKVSLRGGLKLGSAVITIALFTALAVSINSMAVAYAAEGSVIAQFADSPQFCVSASPVGNSSVAVGISSAAIDGKTVSVYSTASPSSLLSIIGAKLEGAYPAAGEALVGKSLSPYVDAGSITLPGSAHNVSGYLPSSPLAYSIIVNQAPSGDAVYFTRLNSTSGSASSLPSSSASGPIAAAAPSFSVLVALVTSETLASVQWLTALLLALLAVVGASQGYRAMNDSSPVALTLGSLSPSRSAVVSSSAAVAAAVALACAALGCAVGLFSSAFLSSLLSSALSLPHVKPAVDIGTALVLSLSFAVSAASLGSGLAFGCISVLGGSARGRSHSAQGVHG